MVKNYCKYLL